MKKLIVIMLLLLLPILSFGQDGGINRGLISGPNFIPSLVGTTTWGAGSGFTWTFDAGTTDPTFTFGSGTVVFGGGVYTFPNVGLTAYDTNASHYLIFKPGSDLTANKTLTFTTGDADRTVTLSGNPTLADWFDQAVKTSSTPIFPTIYGSTADNGDITIEGTSSATKTTSYVILQPTGGNVGIGTTPDNNLHIKGTSPVGITFETSADAGKGYFALAGGNTAQFSINRNIAGTFSDTGAAAAVINFIGVANNSSISFYTSPTSNTNPVERLRVDKDGNVIVGGNVGIGTTTPVGKQHTVMSSTAPTLFGGDTIGSYTSCTFPTANKDYVNKTAIGTGASHIGDLLIVTGGTAATTGKYRIIALVSANSVQVDRNIHTSGANITNGTVSTVKDVVSIGITDGTNGQMLTSWSAQNKPLQIGGTTLAATTGLTSADIYFGGNIGFSSLVANATTAVTFTSLGPASASLTIVGWISFIDAGGTTRYIPYW